MKNLLTCVFEPGDATKRRVNGGLKVSNYGGIKLSTCQSLS